MQRKLILFLSILLYSPTCAFFSYAQSQSSAPVAENSTKEIYGQDMEKLLKAQEDILRKIKREHVHQERKAHIQDTDYAYHEGQVLYRLQRPGQAREIFSNVENLTPGYKSTDAYLRKIDAQSAEGLQLKLPSIDQAQNPQREINLAQEASILYHQAANLGNNSNTVKVKKKLTKLMNLQEKSKQAYIQRQLDKMAQVADNYEKEIFKLTQAKDYSGARRKYLESQQFMIDELMRIKQTIANVNNRYQDEEKYSTDY